MLLPREQNGQVERQDDDQSADKPPGIIAPQAEAGGQPDGVAQHEQADDLGPGGPAVGGAPEDELGHRQTQDG